MQHPDREGGWPLHYWPVENDGPFFPLPDRPVRRSVQPGEEGGSIEKACPLHVRFFGEDCPDGFRDDTPSWVSYCPNRVAKRPVEEHERCPYFRGEELDTEGGVTSILCAYPDEEKKEDA
ncbi:MAG: hypothetical protein QF819_06720 [Gemmatimonadota bacterium]|jgi:hypothetical protein|nr:hypothetical protein [Gemmatimonadota bacterium]MDP6461658.1 hypothetical protein [Gemmatimonadota bacterium]MDP6529163.1 hypothetical protein [Gemmatimonadota bacterium]MDP6802852.1 hypothetical protein [Gemmatimonadota bacterium]MDP7032202.1 hypothetical protein [Gemmatimonadota bacterium]